MTHAGTDSSSAPPPSADSAEEAPGPGDAAAGHTGALILLEEEPRNLETAASALCDLVTPTASFYIRNHFPEPDLDVATWRLRVEGAVERSIELTYADLVSMAAHTRTAMLECAGNGRAFLTPKEPGAQWTVGAAGNAHWTGVPLPAILERAGLRSDAVDVVFEGADHGEVEEEPTSPGDIHYVHSIPVATARRDDVLVAYRMNGAPLTRAHGFPARAIVPGWYGMASVKWLQRLVVTDAPFHGFFESVHYTRWERPHGTPTQRPLTEMHVKAVILVPEKNGTIRAGEPNTVRGLAWTGSGTVRRVEISVDGGRTWSDARLTSPPCEHTWRSWEHDWTAPIAGRYLLMARATDSAGRTQPMERDRDRRNYEISHVTETPVLVTGA